MKQNKGKLFKRMRACAKRLKKAISMQEKQTIRSMLRKGIQIK
jgi:hypothetical protein